jgi:DNA-binding transcriptional MerR regulator|nr:MerR family transcriptional regulator [uncultured Lachnoclostridium sp.]
MNNLIKIKDVSSKYSITARTLRYYEDMGLINSARSDDYAYRMYDENAVRRLEQILILRKLNISIKDIQRIFSTSSSDIVLEVLEKKVQNIDDEVALLHELKDIVLDFIHEIERVDFSDNSDIKLLYDKARELETQLISVGYIGKPSNVNRLIEITEKLDNKIPDVMVVRIPRFKAVTSGDQLWGDIFENGGYMNQLWKHLHLYKSVIFDCFDFLLPKNDKAEWICAVKEGVTDAEVSPLNLIDFPGGLYAMAVSIDEDDESINKVQNKIFRWLESTNFELDNSRDFMCNMPYLDEGDIANKDIEKGLGYKQLQRYVPIKLKDDIR